MPKIMKSINVISRCQTVYRTARLPELAGGYHMYIYAVCGQPGRSQEELARDLNLNKSSVARALSYLEEEGYVRREPDARDRRERRVYPTERAEAILPRVREVSAEWTAEISSGISEGDMAIFESVLAKIAERARAVAGREDLP